MALSHSGLRRKAQAVHECPSFSSILLEQTVTRRSCLLSASPQRSYMEVELLKVSRSWGERCILSHTPITEAAASGCGPKCIQWDLFSKVIFVTERWNARNNKGALKTTSADKDRQDYWKRLVSHLGKGSLCFQMPLWKISWPDCGLLCTGELITDSTPPWGCSAACGIPRKKIIEKKLRKKRLDWTSHRKSANTPSPARCSGMWQRSYRHCLQVRILSSMEHIPSSLGDWIHKVKDAA